MVPFASLDRQQRAFGEGHDVVDRLAQRVTDLDGVLERPVGALGLSFEEERDPEEEVWRSERAAERPDGFLCICSHGLDAAPAERGVQEDPQGSGQHAFLGRASEVLQVDRVRPPLGFGEMPRQREEPRRLGPKRADSDRSLHDPAATRTTEGP